MPALGELARTPIEVAQNLSQRADLERAMLAERLHVRVPWSRTMHGGRYKDRQPEQLTAEELAALVG